MSPHGECRGDGCGQVGKPGIYARVPYLKEWIDAMLATIPTLCPPVLPKGALSLYEQVSNSTAWAGKPKFVKIYFELSTLELRCASAAYGAGMKYWALVNKPGGIRRCALFAFAASTCQPGQKKPFICRQQASAAYKLKE